MPPHIHHTLPPFFEAIQQNTGRLIVLALICAAGVIALDYFWPAKK